MGLYRGYSVSLLDATDRATSGFRLLRLTHKPQTSS